jgi:hypothetical protein
MNTNSGPCEEEEIKRVVWFNLCNSVSRLLMKRVKKFRKEEEEEGNNKVCST